MSFLNTSVRVLPVAVQADGPDCDSDAWTAGLGGVAVTAAFAAQPTATHTAHLAAGVSTSTVTGITAVASVIVAGEAAADPDRVLSRSLTLFLPDGTKLFVSLPTAD